MIKHCENKSSFRSISPFSYSALVVTTRYESNMTRFRETKIFPSNSHARRFLNYMLDKNFTYQRAKNSYHDIFFFYKVIKFIQYIDYFVINIHGNTTERNLFYIGALDMSKVSKN